MSDITVISDSGSKASEKTDSYSKKLVQAVALATGSLLLAVVLWYSLHGLLLVFTAILVGVFFRAMSTRVALLLKISSGWALLSTLILFFGALTLIGFLMAKPLAAQFDELSKTLPQSLQRLQKELDQYEWARGLLAKADSAQEIAETTGVVEKAPRFLTTLIGLLGTALIVVVTGIYLALDPHCYMYGVVKLFPLHKRDRLFQVLNEGGEVLRAWLTAQLIAMFSAAVMTFAAMKLLGVPLALILGLLAGLLEFIPNFGPVIAFVPGILLALTQGPMNALYVLLAYLGIQLFQSNVIQPFTQQRAASLPAALNIAVLLVVGLLLGTLGLLVASPLLAVTILFVKRLYIEDVLGDREPQKSIV